MYTTIQKFKVGKICSCFWKNSLILTNAKQQKNNKNK